MSMLRRGRLRQGVILFLTVLAAVLAWRPVAAQWTPFPPPVDSPFWWTLTDDISPAELRQALQDRDANRQRFRRSAEAGAFPEIVTEQHVHQVTSYLDGAKYPGLVPFYVAFEAYAARFEVVPGWDETNDSFLTQYGIPPAGIAELRRGVESYTSRRDALVQEVAPLVLELMDALRPLTESEGAQRLDKLLVQGNVQELARLSGRDVEWIASRRKAWQREPIVEAALPALEQLRAELSPADWRAFRLFLFEQVAPMISGIDTKED